MLEAKVKEIIDAFGIEKFSISGETFDSVKEVLSARGTTADGHEYRDAGSGINIKVSSTISSFWIRSDSGEDLHFYINSRFPVANGQTVILNTVCVSNVLLPKEVNVFGVFKVPASNRVLYVQGNGSKAHGFHLEEHDSFDELLVAYEKVVSYKGFFKINFEKLSKINRSAAPMSQKILGGYTVFAITAGWILDVWVGVSGVIALIVSIRFALSRKDLDEQKTYERNLFESGRILMKELQNGEISE